MPPDSEDVSLDAPNSDWTLKYFGDASPFILRSYISVTYQIRMFHVMFWLRVFRWRFISVMYHVNWRDLNHTINIQTMTYINLDGPKMSYINKSPINDKKFKNNDKVAWCQNKIQSIILLLLYNALLCMSDYIPSASSAINLPRPLALSPTHQCLMCLSHDGI